MKPPLFCLINLQCLRIKGKVYSYKSCAPYSFTAFFETFLNLKKYLSISLQRRSEKHVSLCVKCLLLLPEFNQNWNVSNILMWHSNKKFHETHLIGYRTDASREERSLEKAVGAACTTFLCERALNPNEVGWNKSFIISFHVLKPNL
jgi:hypothetical protein